MQTWVLLERQGQKYFLEMPHVRYYEFATRNFIKFQEQSKLVDKLLKKTIVMPKEDDKAAWYEYHNSMINVLLYSALSLEAYINYYGTRYDIPFNNDLERLSTLNKFKMYPTIKTRRTIDIEALNVIKKFFKLRDGFVHAKPERLKHGVDSPDESNSASAVIEREDKGKIMCDLNYVYQSIFKIDDDEKKMQVKTPWLHQFIKREED